MTLALSKAQFEDPKFKQIKKRFTKIDSWNKYELEFINNMKIMVLKNLLLRLKSRRLKQLRSKEEGTTRIRTIY